MKAMLFGMALGFIVGYYVASLKLRREKIRLVKAYRNQILKIPRYFYMDSRTIDEKKTKFFENPYN